MTLFASLDKVPIVHGCLTLPFSGLWYADIVVAETHAFAGVLSLVLANQTFRCSVIRAVNFAGARGVRVVAGAAGWRNTIPPRQYAHGVLMSVVLRDAAVACGEQINVTEDEQLGDNYIRVQAPASRVLNDLLHSRWWADPDGVVQMSTRSALPIASDFTAISVQGASGMYTIATDDIASWMPGRTFNGPTASGVISRVEHQITKGQLRTVVLSQ